MEKWEILRQLDAAIDDMDIDAVERGLEALGGLEDSIAAEDPMLFAARVQSIHREKESTVNRKKIIGAAVAAALVAAMGLTVYAATTRQFFSFTQGDQLVRLSTNQEMTEEEARRLVTQAPDPSGEAAQPGAPDTQDYTFADAAQAEQQLGIPVALPPSLPPMELESATGSRINWPGGGVTTTLWLNYADEEGRIFGLTISRESWPEGEDTTAYTLHDIDEGSLDAYTAPGGAEFTLLTESDNSGDNTAHIAVARTEAYEVALVFLGFDEADRQAALDSLDLAAYR